MVARGSSETRAKVTISLSSLALAKLNELARANKRTASSEARNAVEFYLTHLAHLQDAAWQSPIERRMEKLENRVSSLLAKTCRAIAQTLFFMTLPYTKGGLPTRPLTKEAFQIVWEQSRAFAADWLRKARLDDTEQDSGNQTSIGKQHG